MIKAIINKKYEIMVSLVMVLILVIIASILMYLLEHNAQPLAFPNIALWANIAPFTTSPIA